jgi:hypothetical protein
VSGGRVVKGGGNPGVVFGSPAFTFFRRARLTRAVGRGGVRQAKASLKSAGMQEGTALHLTSSLIAGFVYSVASLPLDTAKTRMQTQVGEQGGGRAAGSTPHRGAWG